MNDPKQGEIWWAELESARRPVLVVTRTEAVPVLTGIVVAPITRTIRSIPSEIRLGEQLLSGASRAPGEYRRR